MNRNEKLLDNLTHFWLQVDEIVEAFRRVISTRLRSISDDLIISTQANRGQLNRRNLPNLISQSYVSQLQNLAQDVNESLLEILLRASRAFPKFVSHSQVKTEALDLSLIDPFGLTELGEDNNTFIIIGEILGITEDEARELFVLLLLFGLSLSDLWQILLVKQRDRMRQRLAQVIDDFSTDDGVINDQVIRRVQDELNNLIVRDTSIQSVSTHMGSVVSSVLFTGINQVIQATVRKNPTVFTGEYLWVGILDSAICKRCASLYGKVFRFFEGPLPQLHPWCRCFVMPILRNVGPVSAGDFNSWLKKQSVNTQNQILGKRGAELFRQGKVRFKDFIQFRNKFSPRERTIDSIERIARK